MRRQKGMSVGFTLIEVLVVIAVIGILVAMLLPALNIVTATARRTQCMNNLKNLGQGLLQYEEQLGVLPPAKINPGSYCVDGSCPDPPPARLSSGSAPIDPKEWPAGTNNRTLNTTGWTLILNYLEQNRLHDKYNFDAPSSFSAFNTGSKMPAVSSVTDTSDIGYKHDNSVVISTKLDIFVCPADSTVWNGTYGDGAATNPYTRHDAAPGNYVFCTGEYDERANSYGFYKARRVAKANLATPVIYPPLGAFGMNGAARIDDIQDGVSKTILIGEAIQAKDSFPQGANSEQETLVSLVPGSSLPNNGPFKQAIGSWGSGSYQSSTAQVYPIDAAESAYSMDPNAESLFLTNYADIRPALYQINTRGAGGKLPPPGVFSSQHSGGANFIFADGSARFLADAIDMKVLYRYTTIDGSIWPANKRGGKKGELVEPPGD